ncbi:PREDICTED: uncharacterized protein LOC108762816 [Trachymyrmex cornetzi]|uniref:uncharacterized protein LOC108762816 n=1 Tax=Trachymyrmex cornetzi TaxID=471704 RepID=UPI00084F7627|nr:PREDICTED: uncharacterized protein LOC108762816 [Trachymyrmex cornetzi]
MGELKQQNILYVLLMLSMMTLTRCGLLEMSQMLWNKTVSGDMTKIGKLDPLRVPLIKIDQSEGDANYRVILKNLEIIGLNGSVLESVHVARGELKSNLSETEAGYVSYSDLRDVDSIIYRFHTVTREPSVPKESFQAIVSPTNRAADIRPFLQYQDTRFDRLQQDQHGTRMFEQNRQYDRRIPLRPAISDGSYRGNLRLSSNFDTNSENAESFKRPAYIQPIYTPNTRGIQGYHRSPQNNKDSIDCDNTKTSQFREHQDSRYDQQDSNAGYYGEQIGDAEVSASEIVETRLKDQDTRPPVSFNREQSQWLDVASSNKIKSSRNATREQSSYIDIVYADDKTNGSVKRFGNLHTDSRENRRVYGIEDVMKNIRENTKFIIYNFTEGEALRKRNDIVKAAIEAKRLKDLIRYAKNYQEQQGYFEEGMQLIYHYGGMNVKNNNVSQNLSDTKRTKRAHPELTSDKDDVMHVILRIRVPLLRVKSQYTLTGKVGKEMLYGNGLLVGNFTDVVGDFTLELKKVNEELIIVRGVRAKLSAKDKKINLQGMDEKRSVQTILSHGLIAAEAVAAMLADDFATKGLSERTADALVYRMYKDLPVN